MLTPLTFLLQINVKKSKKLAKKLKLKRKKSYLLNDSMSFSETFRKNITYDNIKSHKKSGLHLKGFTSPPPTFLELNLSYMQVRIGRLTPLPT